MAEKIQSIPEARLLLASLRSVGYNEETAIADIIDNCIAAQAHEIKIQFDWEKKRIVISDDGFGMSKKDLIENMRIGSSDPSKIRSKDDLGRFGMGMKTAAFSLGKKLTVVTKANLTVSNASWDLDQISEIGWNLIIRDESEISEFSSKMGERGTIVIIENLDRVIDIDDEKKAQNIHVDSYECTEKDGLLANIRSFAVFDYLKGILTSGEDGYAINSGVLCAADFGAPQKRERFVVMGIKKSISAVVFLPSRKIKDGHYKTVHDAIYDLEDVPPVYDLADDEEGIPLEHKEQLSSVAQQLRDSDILKNHIITKTTDVAMARFKALHQGENFHSLEESLKTNTYTDVKRTQNTIYLRLNYNEPSGTVLNVRKSMWIHPTLDRAISIREAARLQTFPDSFVFCGSKDKQYQQVGNAVPPIMAKAIAKQLAATLGKKLREAEQENVV